MSDSGSETYESADEEYEVKNKSQQQQQEKLRTTLKNDSILKEKENPSHNVSNAQLISTSSSKSNKEKSSISTVAAAQSSKQESTNEKLDSTDGWDLDDWGDDDNDEINEDTEDNLKLKEKESEKNIITTDKWDDFDDWGEEESPKETPQHEIQKSEVSRNTIEKSMETKNKTTTHSSSQYRAESTRNNTEVQQNSSWVWKPWGGVVSLLSTATEGVTTLSSQVSSAIEKSMGLPNPEEMAKINVQNDKEKQQKGDGNKDGEINENQEMGLPSLGSIVTGVTSIGNKVITGGLDTLEEIGKKTMNILQENDPLLLNKRKLLGLENEEPNLSQILREAKEKSEEIEKNLKQIQKQSYKRQLHFETLFDHYYGLVHLEALEMLSKQSNLKLQSLLEPLTGNAKIEMEETLNEVKELCELNDMENDENDGSYDTDELKMKFVNAIEDLDVKIDFNELLKCWKENIEWLSNDAIEKNATEVYERGLKCLAESCALSMLKLHKIAELLLIKEHHSTVNEADALVQLTNVLCFHLNGIANRFGNKLNSFKSEEINSMITSLFVEVGNSTSYIQSAFQLFIPILQIGVA